MGKKTPRNISEVRILICIWKLIIILIWSSLQGNQNLRIAHSNSKKIKKSALRSCWRHHISDIWCASGVISSHLVQTNFLPLQQQQWWWKWCSKHSKKDKTKLNTVLTTDGSTSPERALQATEVADSSFNYWMFWGSSNIVTYICRYIRVVLQE